MSIPRATARPSSPMPASLASKALSRSARTPPTVPAARLIDSIKMKNSDAPAVKREEEEEWGRSSHRYRQRTRSPSDLGLSIVVELVQCDSNLPHQIYQRGGEETEGKNKEHSNSILVLEV